MVQHMYILLFIHVREVSAPQTQGRVFHSLKKDNAATFVVV